MSRISTREAINRVIASELLRDRRTVYLGETIREGGATGASRGLYQRFGERQVIETPVSENGIVGASLGLALSGYRPIVEIYSADFALAVANEIMGDIPKWRQQQGRAGGLPITLRGWMGAVEGLGPEHSQCMEAYFHHAPGLTIIVPGTPSDMAGLLRGAIRSPDPVLLLEHRRTYDMVDDVPDDPDYAIAIGKGQIIRDGNDLTMVAWGWMRHLALQAVERLSAETLSAELIDPRTIKPMDFDLIMRSVAKTGRLLVVEESPLTGSVGGEILARATESLGQTIQVARVAMPDMIHPYSARMEKHMLPDVNLITIAAHSLVRGTSRAAFVKNPFEQEKLH